jgi:hypothetical protein
MSMGDFSIFCSLLQSFSSVVCSSHCRGHLYLLLSLFLGNWVFFETIVYRIVFLYSFSFSSLLVYRKVIDFCKLILYSHTLLKLFMVSRNFWVEFLESLRYRIMLSVNRYTLTTSLLIYSPFISSSCFMSLDRNSRTMLNRSEKNGHACLIPDFRGNGFSFSQLIMMLGYRFITCCL